MQRIVYSFILVLFSFLTGWGQDSARVLQESWLDSTLLFLDWEHDDIVVVGQYVPTDVRNTVSTVRVIDKETIQESGAVNLEDLLNQQQSIRITQDAVLGGQMQMQGLSGEYVQILVDGVPMIGRNDGNLDLGRINLQNVERVEILEGPSAVQYGTNALAGTINIVTKQAQAKTVDAHISTHAETFGIYNLSAGIGGKWKGVTLRGNYIFNHNDGYSTDTFRTEAWNPKTQHHIDALVRKDFKNDFSIGYNFKLLDEQIWDKGLLKLENFPSLTYAKDYYFLTKTQDHSLFYRGKVAEKYYINGTAAYNQYTREKNAYWVPFFENEDPFEQDSLDSDTTTFRTFNVRTTFASDYRKKFDFQVGIDARYNYTAGARINDTLDTSIGDYAIFGGLTYRPFEQLTIQPSFRWSYNTKYNAPFTYTIAAAWSFHKDWKLRGTYARGFRAPSLKELYLDFVDANHFILGNPNLKAERSHSAQLGIDYDANFENGQQLSVRVVGFYNNIEDQISLFDFAYDSLGNLTASDIPTNQYAYFNVDNYRTQGIDARIEWTWGNFLLRFGGIATGRSSMLANDYEDVPPMRYTLEFSQELRYTIPKWDMTFNLVRKDYDRLIRFGLVYNPITGEDEVFESIIDGYSLMNFSVSKRFLEGKFTLQLGARNIFGVQEVVQIGAAGVHGGGGGLAVNRGRSYFVRLNWNLN